MHGLFEDKLCSLIDVLKAKCKQSEGCMDIYGCVCHCSDFQF